MQVLCPPCCEETPQTPSYRTHHKQEIHQSCSTTKLRFLYYRKTYFNAWIILIMIIFCAASHTQTLTLKQKGGCWQSAPFSPALTNINPSWPADDLYECLHISIFNVWRCVLGNDEVKQPLFLPTPHAEGQEQGFLINYLSRRITSIRVKFCGRQLNSFFSFCVWTHFFLQNNWFSAQFTLFNNIFIF